MKLKLHLITIALLFLAIGVRAENDDVIKIHQNNTAAPTTIAIGDISKIVFEAKQFNVVTKNSDADNYFNYSEVAKITFHASVGVESVMAEEINATVFPNPAKDNLMIAGAEKMYGSDLYIYSLTGTLVSKYNNWNGESLDVSHLNSGIYFVNINTTTIKFVKQ